MENTKKYVNSYGNAFGSMMSTPIGRAQYVHLVEPGKKFQPPKFSVHILFSKNDVANTQALMDMKAACQALAVSKYADKVPAMTYPALRDGDEEDGQGFQGCWYIKAQNKQRPEIVDTQKKGLDPAIVVPGTLIRCVVVPILFDGGYSWQLQLVQFVKDDGVRYYGGPDPKSLLSALDVSSPAEPSVGEAASAVMGGKEAAKNLL